MGPRKPPKAYGNGFAALVTAGNHGRLLTTTLSNHGEVDSDRRTRGSAGRAGSGRSGRGGDRTGANEAGPLAGVVLGLYSTGGTLAGQCTSDSDGDCSFIVADTESGGANNGARFTVRQISAPSGWFTSPDLRTGNGSGSSSNQQAYEFETPALEADHVYRSTSDFMFSDDKTLLTASGGVWQDSRNDPDMPRSCGIDAALLLDLSASVGSDLPFLKSAANTFVNSLTGTPSRIAVFSFSGESPSTGTENHPALTSVATSAGADTVKNTYATMSPAPC